MKLVHCLHLRRLRTGAILIVPLLTVAALAGCGASGTGTGASASAGATATPTCPPASTFNFKTVSGSITSVSSGSITVTTASGTATPVTIGSSTVITIMAAGTPADLTAGTPVQVITDTNATTAQRIRILSGTGAGAGAGTGGFGGFGGRGANATPPAGANAACARRGRGTPGTGAGGRGTDTGGQGAGAGTGSGFQGLRGTVDSATSNHLIFDDIQGQTYSVSITSSTIITKTTAGKASDLKTGMKVMVIGAASSSGGISARAITVQGTPATA